MTGDDNVLAYGGSNVVKDHTGTVNGNTGDTDTSGLNVVDASARWCAPVTPATPTNHSIHLRSIPRHLRQHQGSVWGPTATGGAASASVADVNGVSTASGADSLVIGGDGIDDNGVRVVGDRNVVTYDDGNVAVGGSGGVNAQIGDSDTSGAVVMAVRDSNIASGDSFLPADQQAGAQMGDPFDGDDIDVEPSATPSPRLNGPAARLRRRRPPAHEPLMSRRTSSCTSPSR